MYMRDIIKFIKSIFVGYENQINTYIIAENKVSTKLEFN
jgi:uncharacterized protein YeeX (DUF496 family)